MSEPEQIISQVERTPEGLRVSVAGEINLSRSPELRTQLMQVIEQQPQQLTVDLGGVSYMDSSGVATLIEILRQQHQRGGTMALSGLRPKVRSIFEIARLDTVFTILDDTEQSGAA